MSRSTRRIHHRNNSFDLGDSEYYRAKGPEHTHKPHCAVCGRHPAQKRQDKVRRRREWRREAQNEVLTDWRIA